VKCWVQISPDGAGNYLASPGQRYAALLSVDTRAKLSDAVDELKKEGFVVTYSWQSGQAGRNQFFIDNWIASLPTPTKGTAWMYFELNYTGSVPKTVARHIQKCILFICGSVDIMQLFEAQEVAEGTHPCGPGDPQTASCPPTPPPCAACPPAPNPWKPALIGAAVGAAFAGVIAAMR
jgi:hypothetical protein